VIALLGSKASKANVTTTGKANREASAPRLGAAQVIAFLLYTALPALLVVKLVKRIGLGAAAVMAFTL
jgi:hypothetical protein